MPYYSKGRVRKSHFFKFCSCFWFNIALGYVILSISSYLLHGLVWLFIFPHVNCKLIQVPEYSISITGSALVGTCH